MYGFESPEQTREWAPVLGLRPWGSGLGAQARVWSASGYPDNSAMIYAPVTRRLFGGSQGSFNDCPES